MTLRNKVVRVLRKKAKRLKREGGVEPVTKTLQDLLVLQPTASRVQIIEILTRNGTLNIVGDLNELR